MPVPVLVPVAVLALFQFHTAARQRPTGDLVKGASSASPFVKFFGLAVRRASADRRQPSRIYLQTCGEDRASENPSVQHLSAQRPINSEVAQAESRAPP